MRTVHDVRRSLHLTGCVIGLIAATAVCAAQSQTTEAGKPGTSKVSPESPKPDQPQADRGVEVRLRRLESFTWNPVTQELTWVLSSGDLGSGGYSPTKQESYVIRMDTAIMKFEGADRHFDPAEAEQVGKLMDLICRYALESTIWWEHGGSEKPDGLAVPDPKSPNPATPDPKTTDPKTKDKGNTDKSRKVPPGMLRGSVPVPSDAPQSIAAAVAAPGR
jgi:hypothetical protein